MIILVFLIGITAGCILSIFINAMCFGLDQDIKLSFRNIINRIKENIHFKPAFKDITIILINTALLFVSFLVFGFSMMLLKAAVLNSILIAVSIIDIRYQLIPDKLTISTIAAGIICLFISNTSFLSAFGGMLLGSGILFLLALIPGAMGGGDIKIMLGLGLFLGINKTIWAIMLAFIFAALVSLMLLVFKIKKSNEHIPFGPFLAIGCYAAFHFIIL